VSRDERDVAREKEFTLLVIDDDELVLGTLSDLLCAHDHRVVTASNGRDGLQLARAPIRSICSQALARMVVGSTSTARSPSAAGTATAKAVSRR